MKWIEVRCTVACTHCHAGWWGVLSFMDCPRCGRPLKMRGKPVMVWSISGDET